MSSMFKVPGTLSVLSNDLFLLLVYIVLLFLSENLNLKSASVEMDESMCLVSTSV